MIRSFVRFSAVVILFFLPLSETYRHGWKKAKIATQSFHHNMD
jgi:hypothetical protein